MMGSPKGADNLTVFSTIPVGGGSGLDNKLKSDRKWLESTVKEALEQHFQRRNGASKDGEWELNGQGNGHRRIPEGNI
jgi:hypothetical protein